MQFLLRDTFLYPEAPFFSSWKNFLPFFYTNSPPLELRCCLCLTQSAQGKEVNCHVWHPASSPLTVNISYCEDILKVKGSGRKQNAASRLCAQGCRFWKCSDFCGWICESWGFLQKEINKALRSIMNAGASMKGAGSSMIFFFLLYIYF